MNDSQKIDAAADLMRQDAEYLIKTFATGDLAANQSKEVAHQLKKLYSKEEDIPLKARLIARQKIEDDKVTLAKLFKNQKDADYSFNFVLGPVDRINKIMSYQATATPGK